MAQYITVSARTLRDPETRFPILSVGRSDKPGSLDRPGILVIETDADPETHEVLNGEVVAKLAADLNVANFTKALTEGYREITQAVRAKQLQFITDLPAQVRRYEKKEAEARAYLADPSPDLADYPRLSDEIGITAPTAQDLATLWVAMADAWDAADRAVEKARMTAKGALASAATIADVDAAMTALHIALDDVQPPSP